MKIFFTKKFREVLADPHRQIELGKYKLRQGDNVGFTKITSENITSDEFLSSTSPTNFYDEQNFYDSQLVGYNGGLQISFEIPEKDASMYEENLLNESFYQIFLFYYTDVTLISKASTSLAFLIYENFDGNIFSGIDLTTRRNIITTPPFDWKCNLMLNQSEQTKILEDEWGHQLTKVTALGNNTEENSYISTESWTRFWIDNISKEEDLEWLETVYLNNFGLKIY